MWIKPAGCNESLALSSVRGIHDGVSSGSRYKYFPQRIVLNGAL
jgi:hypothetical protein